MIARHTQWSWLDFADCYIRSFRSGMKPLTIPAHNVIHYYEGRGEVLSYLVQFTEPLSPDMYMTSRVAPSFAPMIFPNLIHPQLKYSIIIHREGGMRAWMEENLEDEMTFIDTIKLVYVTTDNHHDMTLIKLRFQEYQGDASN